MMSVHVIHETKSFQIEKTSMPFGRMTVVPTCAIPLLVKSLREEFNKYINQGYVYGIILPDEILQHSH